MQPRGLLTEVAHLFAVFEADASVGNLSAHGVDTVQQRRLISRLFALCSLRESIN